MATGYLSMRKTFRRSLIFVLAFAVGGFLLAFWDLEFNFDPLPWAGLRYFLQAACFEVPLILWFGGQSGRLLLLWPASTAGIYGAIGFVVGRALRRLPSKVQDPQGHKLVGRCVLYFAAFGYVLPLWIYGLNLAPLHWEFVMGFFWGACVVCVNDAHPNALGAFLSDCPVNSAIYAGRGWAIGRAIRR